MSQMAIMYGKTLCLPSEYDTLGGMLIYIAENYPAHGLTFVDKLGNESFVSYPALLKTAQKTLNGLRKKGIKSGDIVILEIVSPEDFYTLFWACILGGVIVAPVSRPSSFEPESDNLLKLFNIWKILKEPIIICEEGFKHQYDILKRSIRFNALNFISNIDLQDVEEGVPYPANIDNMAVLQFSSGSTGDPKGVILTHRNILSNIGATRYAYHVDASDKVFTWLPHTHDMGLFAQHLGAVIQGCDIFIFSPLIFIRSPYLFLKKITEHKATWFLSPSFGLDWMIQNIQDHNLPSLDLSSLRFLGNGAEPISIHVMNNFIKKFSKCGLKETTMCLCYGLAEATVAVTNSIIGAAPKIASLNRSSLLHDNCAVAATDDLQTDDIIHFVHVGYPIPGMNVRIVDNDGKLLEENRVGEIQIQGASVSAGYYAESHKKRYDNGWLSTGDLGVIVDGSLIVTGRIKDIILIHGKNYYSHDLEEMIYAQGLIPRGNLVFVGLFHDRSQQEELLVFVKHKSNLSGFLPIQKNIIEKTHEVTALKITHVIPVKVIPKTTSGKLQRFFLRQNYENGDYDDVIKETARLTDCLDETATCLSFADRKIEEEIRKIWSKTLHISEKEISMDDEFFLLGGGSIQAFQVLDAMRQYFQIYIDPEILFECKTIRQIINYIKKDKCSPRHLEYNERSPDTSIDSRLGDPLSQAPRDDARCVTHYGELNTDKAIAITGMALRFPFAQTQEKFWENLCKQTACITKVSKQRKKLSRASGWDDWLGELDNIDFFDNEFFDISEEESIFMDPQQRLILEVSYQALEDAGVISEVGKEQNIGVYSGVSGNTYYQLLAENLKKEGEETFHQNTLIGNMCNMISARIAQMYHFTGPALNIDTACSSFLVALHHAVLALRQNSIKGALVASANILTTQDVHMLAKKAGILSSSPHAKVFDKDADGSVLGEGVVVFYLEPLSQAIESCKHIYGVIRGTAVNNDGSSLSPMTPNPRGQYHVLLDAYRDADLSPFELDYVEMHGTGTTIGDPIEVHAWLRLFEQYQKLDNKNIGIGSVKTNVGHLLPAAGGAGLAKILLCLKNKKLIPNMHLKHLNPALHLEKSPFYVVESVQDWTLSHGAKSRKAGLSSFGLGGTNAHVVIEEWDNNKTNTELMTNHLLTLSAKSKKALERMTNQAAGLIEGIASEDFTDLCFTKNCYRPHYSFRAVLLFSKHDRKITTILNGDRRYPLINKFTKIYISLDLLDNAVRQNSMVFEKTHRGMMQTILKKNNIICNKIDEPKLLYFLHWYFSLKDLVDNVKNKINFVGTRSGQILADLLNETIDLPQALGLYQQTSGKLSENVMPIVDLTSGVMINFVDTTLSEQTVDTTKNVTIDIKLYHTQELQSLFIMGSMYAVGVNFKWDQLYPDDARVLCSVLPYPFMPKTFWIHPVVVVH